MEHQFRIWQPLVFPDGGVFVAVASLTLDRCSTIWSVPIGLEDQFRSLCTAISEQNCFDPSFLTSQSSDLNAMLQLPDGTIQWRPAAAYEYIANTPPPDPQIKSYFNNVDALPPNTRTDRMHDLYRRFRYSTCCIESEEIVSICVTDNGAVSIETKPLYRRQGFGAACLMRITKELLELDIRPKYGTGYENTASRRTAVAAGFTLTEYMYWIEIAAARRAQVSDHLERLLDAAIAKGDTDDDGEEAGTL